LEPSYFGDLPVIIQSLLSGPAFETVTYSGSAGSGTITITGWPSFKELVAQISAALPSSWTCSYNETLDRVQFVAGSNTLNIVFSSLSFAEALGFSAVSNLNNTSTLTSPNAPQSLCPLIKAHYSTPVPGNKPNLRTYRHGRASSVSWGKGTRYQIETIVLYENADRILAGSLSSGKVRVGLYSASSAYSGSNQTGYLDGFVIGEPSVEVLQDDQENHCIITFVLSVPDTAHSATTLKDSFWGLTSRGYSLNYYTLIEGLPYRFCEVDPGLSDSNRTVSPTLIIDNSQTMTTKIDRQKGLSAASGCVLGILDPLNSLGIFSKPTFEVQIASEVAYNATQITLAASTDSLPTSGFVFLGTECLKYTGNTGSSGSPANTLTGITRPFGPGYEYGTKTVQRFRTVTNTKKAWQGTAVRLFALLIDPFGRPVDDAWEDTYYRQIGGFQVQGLPGYDNGLWVLDCKDIIRRLTQPVVAPISGQVSPFDNADPFDQLQNQGNEASQVIVDNKNGIVRATYRYLTSSGNTNGGSFTIDMGGVGAPARYASLAESLEYCLNVINGQTIPGSAAEFGSSLTVQTCTHFGVLPENFKIEDNGTVIAQTKTVYKAFGGVSIPEITGTLHFEPNPSEGPSPSWLTKKVIVCEFQKDIDETITDVSGLFDGTTTDFVVIDQTAENAEALGTFPTSGYAVLGGESNEDGQLVEYGAKTTFGSRVILTDLIRLEGNPQSTIKKGKSVTAAELIEGSVGQLIATMLESSGFATSARGSFDTLPKGYGYALLADDYVQDAASGDGQTMAGSFLGAPATIPNLRFALTQGLSVEDIFAGLLSAFGFCISWVRHGAELQIGMSGTYTVGFNQDYTITDTDLIAGKAATIKQIGTSPNVVTVRQASSMLGKGGAQYTYRIVEDVAARGAQTTSVSLFGLNASDFFTIAEQFAARLADGSFAQTAYELTVTGERDYLAGQLVNIETTYPGLWDFQTETQGFSGQARITSVARNLSTNQVKLVVLVNGLSQFLNLCPVAFVTNYDTSSGSPKLTVTDSEHWNTDTATGIRIELPGVNNGSGHSTFQETVVTGIAGNVLTLQNALTFSPTAYTVATYPQDDATLTTFQKNNFCHISDGSRYS
jgi:hypothetical protein